MVLLEEFSKSSHVSALASGMQRAFVTKKCVAEGTSHANCVVPAELISASKGLTNVDKSGLALKGDA